MKKAVIAIIVVGLVGAGGYGVYHHFFEKTDGATERVSSTSEDAVYVDQVSAITGFGSGNGYVSRFGGEVEPQETLEVKLESERKVGTCFVKEGDEVKEGQRLFIYDTQEEEDKLAEAEIEIEKAEGEIEIAKKSITENEKSRAKASADEQLTYTMEILTLQNQIKQQEYEIKTKKREMEHLKEGIENATVTADMGGTVQKIQDPNSDSGNFGYGYSGGEDSAYITILSSGDFRIKGSVNEQNMSEIQIGMPMIVHSRVDETVTWNGEIVDITDKAEEDDNNNFYYGGNGGESSKYAFYVELENSEGLMLGQHVYMEENRGQDEKKDGLWLEEYYLVQEDGEAYVWKASKDNVLEKQIVTLGEYDDAQMKYEITEGLEPEDYITMPQEGTAEGTPVIYNDYSTENPDMGGMDFGDDMGPDGDMGFEEDMDFDGNMGFEEGMDFDGNMGFEEDMDFDDDMGFEDDMSSDGDMGFEDDMDFEEDFDGGEVDVEDNMAFDDGMAADEEN